MSESVSGFESVKASPGKEFGSKTKRILCVTEELPGFQQAGHTVWLAGIFEALANAGHDVVCTTTTHKVGFIVRKTSDLNFEIEKRNVSRLFGRYVVVSPKWIFAHLAWNVFQRLPQRLQVIAAGIRSRLRKRDGGGDHRLGSFLTAAQRDEIRRTVEAVKPDVILYNSLFLHTELPEARIPAAILVHDLVHERASSLHEQGYHTTPATFTADDEIAVLKRADMMLCIQWDDAEFIKRKLVNSRVVALPPPMAAVPRRVAHRDPVCIFVGSGALPNVDGVQWFLEAVWPGVLARVPSAQLRVYGSVCSRVETSSESVKLLGRVDDIVSCYDEAKLAVVPLRIGSGLKIKIVEAITMGMPIVTTEVGAQGLFEIRPQPFALCKSADEMIARTAALLLSDEECGTLEAAARGAQALFDPQRISAVLDAAMREISVESPIIDNEAR